MGRVAGSDDGALKQALAWLGLLIMLGAIGWWETLPRSPRVETTTLRGPLPGGLVSRVVIDAGHGGQDSGAIRDGILEKDLTLDVARRLDVLIRAEGMGVTLTRHGDETVSLSERARLANQESDCVFVSIHFDEGGRGAASGVQTFYAAQQSVRPSSASWFPFFQQVANAPVENLESQSLAGFIQESLVAQTQSFDRGTRTAQFFVVANVHHPAVLVEGGFLSNAEDRARMTTGDYRQRLAEAIRDGIMRYRQVAGQAQAVALNRPGS